MPDSNTSDRISLSSVLELGKNSFRLLRLMWHERRRLVFWRCVVVVAVAIMPFLQLTMLGVLVNRLVGVAGKAANVRTLDDFVTQKPLGDYWTLVNLGALVLGVVAVRVFLPFFITYKNYL